MDNEALDSPPGSIAKEGRLYVIPLPLQRIELVGFPEAAKYGIFLGNIAGEIDQHG